MKYKLIGLYIIIILFYLFIDNHIKIKNKIKNKYNTEIHFITFWKNDNNDSKKRLNDKISLHNKNNEIHIRILQKIIINKKDINNIFKNVSSGGKHNLHDIEVYIMEVPIIYKIRKTYDNPRGELVNDIMYELKISVRGNYSNYKLAHGSFNKEEMSDFTKEYFKHLGNFKNYNEVFNDFIKSDLFWFSDRVTSIEDSDIDIDLVVESIPATCFLLRLDKNSNKSYVNLDGKSKLFDLRDFNSNYYPKEWLLDIKKNNKIILKNYIFIPTEKDHFMLGLYHMYIHKYGKQNDNRINKLNKMSKKLNIDINVLSLFNFLNKKKYIISKPVDKLVGFNIEIKTEGGDKTKETYKYGNKYYYLYKKKEIYNKNIDIYNKLKHYNFIPEILYHNNESLVFVSEDSGEKLNKTMKINNFKHQIDRIRSILKKHNIIHNDININNVLVKDNIVYLIDWDHAFYKNKNNPRSDKFGDYYCKTLPKAKKHDVISYINNNGCLKGL